MLVAGLVLSITSVASAQAFTDVLGLTLEDGVLGARVAAVEPNSQADELGLETDDIIVQIAGHYVTSAWDLMARIDGIGPHLRLHIRHEGREARDVVLRRPQLDGKIVFRSDRSGVGELWRMNADGSCLRQLTSGNRNPQGPAWSPDGKWIAFEWWTPYLDIWMVDENGHNLRRLTTHPDAETRPRWSADGAYVYFLSYEWGGTAIGRVNIETLQRQPVVGIAGDAGSAPWRYPVYDLSPDGKLLAYPLQTDQGWKLRLAGADGANPQTLLLPAGDQIALDWSADGRLLLWTASDDTRFVRDMETGWLRLFRLDRPGWGVLTPDGEGIIHDWADPDGRTDLYVSDLDGHVIHRLTYHPAGDTQPDWWAPEL